jgi:hypothetical protein
VTCGQACGLVVTGHGLGTSTRIDFASGTASLGQGASVVSVSVSPLVTTFLEPLTLSFSGGASLGGRLELRGDRYLVQPGWIVGGGASYRFGGRGPWPFLQPSVSYSISNATAIAPDGASAGFKSLDWRLGAAAGKTIGSVAAPFVVARHFGGGTDFALAGGHGADHYRFHVGVGSAFGLSRQIDAVVELAFLGERRATVGFGYSF